MTEELRVRRVPVTDGQTVRYVNTYALSEYDLVNSETSDVNAFVPNDAPILPPQVFVDNITKFVVIVDKGTLNLSNLGITAYNSSEGLISIFCQNLANFGLLPFTLNLSGNALDVTSEYAIFAELINLVNLGLNPSGCSLDISGGTNAGFPLPVFLLDFTSVDVAVSGGVFGNCDTTQDHLVRLESERLLDDTLVDFTGSGNFIRVGTADTPTPQQIITKVVSLGDGKIVDSGNNTITVSPTDHALESLGFNDAPPLTGISGHLISGNNNLGNLRITGVTVTTN